MNITDYAANKILDHMLGKAAWTMPSVLYLALYTTATDNSGGGTEATGGNYSRIQIPAASLSSAASRAITNTAAIVFAIANGAQGMVTHAALHDHATAGNMLAQGSTTTSQAIVASNQYSLPIGDLDVSFTP